MIVRIFDESVPAREQEVILRLFRDNFGKIVVGVVDEEGNLEHCGILIEFQKNMSMLRKGYVDSDFGIPLDDENRIVEVTG